MRSFEDCIEKVSYGNKIQRTEYLSEGKYPVVSQESKLVNGFWNNEADVFDVDKPVIVFGDHTRTLKFIDFSFVLGADGAKIIKPKSFVDSKFFYYFLQANPLGEKGYARHYRFLKELNLNVPPLPIQQKIVAKLDAIFAEINKASAVAEANAKNAEALFSQVLNNLENEYDGAVKELGECVELLSGFAFKSNEYSNSETDIPLLRGDNLNPKNIDFSEAKRFDRSRFDEYFKFSLATNDIVLGMDRPLISAGLRIAKVQSKDVPSLLVQRVMRLRCNKNVDSDFLFYLLNSTNFIKHLVGEQTGLGVPHVSGKTISSFLLKIPTIEIQRKIVTKLSAILESLNSYKLANKNILINWTLYKQAILTQAFNGELVNE